MQRQCVPMLLWQPRNHPTPHHSQHRNANSQQQQHNHSSAEQSSAAEGSGSSQDQNGSAGSKLFTPGQQAVAAALMAVLTRAMEGGKKAALAAKGTLISNNPDTQPLLDVLPENGPLPTVQQIEQKASDQLMMSLTKLAKQCEAASCQPLELFTRSMQCNTRKAGVQKICISTSVHERQAQRNQAGMTLPDGWCSTCTRDLQQLGVPQRLADLMVAYVQVLGWQQSEGDETANPDLNHMLPGKLEHPAMYKPPSVPVSSGHRGCRLQELQTKVLTVQHEVPAPLSCLPKHNVGPPAIVWESCNTAP